MPYSRWKGSTETEVSRNCVACGAAFLASTPAHKYCGAFCREFSWAKQRSDWKRRKRNTVITVIGDIPCPNCGTMFTSKQIGNSDVKKYCSKKCGKLFWSWQNSMRLRTGILYDSRFNTYINCEICGCTVDTVKTLSRKYCKECAIIATRRSNDLHAKRKRESKHESVRLHDRKESIKRQKMLKIAKVALEMFPHLKDLLDDPR